MEHLFSATGNSQHPAQRHQHSGSPRPPHPTPAAQNELFHFHPWASNPELWRTTVPLIVRHRCERHKGLVATWTAIHWLIVLYAASGRCAFGMREIAQEAGVGRNELAGPRGYIQRLVALGLLTIVGYEPVPGVKEHRPIYYIDLTALEGQSLDLVPTLLRERRLPAPPRPAPDPRQLALFAPDLPETRPGHSPGPCPNDLPRPETGTGEQWQATRFATGEPANGTVAQADAPKIRLHSASLPETGTVTPQGWPANGHPSGSTPAIGTARAPYRHRRTQNITPRPKPGQTMPETGTGIPAPVTDHARNRDVDREREEKERVSEIAHAPDFIQQLVAATTRAVLATLAQQGVVAPAPPPTGIDQVPPAPAAQPALPSSVAVLWQGEREQVPSRERSQLALLADTYNNGTGGFGAYWLGRAILLADVCLTERGRPLSFAYVRSILRRWAHEASWGSDLVDEPAGQAAPPTRPQQTHRRDPVTNAGTTSAEASVAAASVDREHPAAVAYRLAFGRTPNSVQAEQMTATVSDLAIWQRVLTEWQANGWQPGAVAKMLDRYRKDAGLAVPPTDEPPPSLRTIHFYPGLEPEQRDRWIYRYHAATSVAEKRAVIARLKQEHPE